MTILYARISQSQKSSNPILDWFDRFGCVFLPSSSYIRKIFLFYDHFYTPAYPSLKSDGTPFWIGLTDLDTVFCLFLLIWGRSSYFMTIFIRPVIKSYFGLV